MERTSNTFWHFPMMIFASLILFYLVVWAVIGTQAFKTKIRRIFLLSMLCVVFGMLLGKFGANWGLKWWIYYPLPMLINVFLPPAILQMNTKKTIVYLLLSFLSAPFIHVFFSFFFNWTEYMPFWKIPYIKTLTN
jgi:hypothetical protein